MAAKSPVRSMAGPLVVRMFAPSSLATTVASVVLPSPGGPENRMWSTTSWRCAGGFYENGERLLHLRLAQVVAQALRAQAAVEREVVFGQRGRHAALGARADAGRRCRTGRLEGHSLYFNAVHAHLLSLAS